MSEPAQRQAFRRGDDRILGGVSSGIAAGLHVDVLWVRLAFVILAFFQGLGVLVYIVLWLVMPEETEAGTRAGFESVSDDLRRVAAEIRTELGGHAPHGSFSGQSVVLGVVLVILGALLLGVNTGFFTWSVVWPVAVIAIGVGFLLRGFGRRA